jgi:hypothetical protein
MTVNSYVQHIIIGLILVAVAAFDRFAKIAPAEMRKCAHAD